MTLARPHIAVPRETSSRDLDARLDALLVECRKHQLAIYRCEGVRPAQSLPFLASVERLLDGLCGVTSLDTYDDVIEALEDAV